MPTPSIYLQCRVNEAEKEKSSLWLLVTMDISTDR